MSKPVIGVKFCGGCRALFDRKAEYERIKAGLSGQAEFETVKDGGKYDSLLVICGCPSRCADISKYHTDGKIITIDNIDNKEGINCLLNNSTKAS